MALTVRQNGTTVGGSSNAAQASWWNDYHDLLTGVMTDQPVTIANSLTVTGTSGYIGSNHEQNLGFALSAVGGETWLGGGINNVKINTSNNAFIAINNYFDGTNDKFMTSSGLATQFVFTNNGSSRLQWRYSTNAASTGTAVTWSSNYAIPTLNSNGGGAAGGTIWVGTTDPGANAVEGDIWIKA